MKKHYEVELAGELCGHKHRTVTAADRCLHRIADNGDISAARILEKREAKEKHTAGPWRAVKSTAGGGTSRMDIVSDGTEFKPSFVAGDILHADTLLIAAAPALLAALKRLADCPEVNFDDIEDETTEAVKQAWEAIFKATGET